jgi:hypothetical protein
MAPVLIMYMELFHLYLRLILAGHHWLYLNNTNLTGTKKPWINQGFLRSAK